MKYSQFVRKVLKESGKGWTAQELAKQYFKEYPDKCKEKQQKSKKQELKTDKGLIDQLKAEAPRYLKGNGFKSTDEKPKKYYNEPEVSVDNVTSNEVNDNAKDFKENDCYQPLIKYLWSELGIYAKRIDEKRSQNKQGPGGNRWLYPDVVGIENLTLDFTHEVKDIVNLHSQGSTARLWSFEVKLEITRSNLRESFYQAVSNSSWANFGYLVAVNIEDKSNTLIRELNILSRAHGIGVIQLNISNPTKSNIIIPAGESIEVDWNIVNRITDENSDFRAYIQDLREFYQTNGTIWAKLNSKAIENAKQ